MSVWACLTPHPCLEFAQEHRLMILMHTWGHSPYDGPALVEKIAKRYPEVTILMGVRLKEIEEQ